MHLNDYTKEFYFSTVFSEKLESRNIVERERYNDWSDEASVLVMVANEN